MNKKIYEIFLYVGSIIALPIQVILIFVRLLYGKEHRVRFTEKFGLPSDIETENLIWIHSASVGETNLAFLLIDLISSKKKDANFLLTSGTISSAELAAKKIANIHKTSQKNYIIHQFFPMDNMFVTQKFFNYWKPKLGIFIESELWPCTSHIGSQFCPLIILNARMSDRSFKRWQKLNFIIKNLADNYEMILTQSKRDFDIYNKLGFKNNIFAGNLKYIQKDAAINKDLATFLKDKLKGKKVILAASTHKTEEELVLNIYRNLKAKYADLFLILAPRHTDRTIEVSELITKYNFKYSRRSTKDDIKKNDSVYLIDTIGELNTIFSIKPITIMGGSFTIGGHNILEPARFESPIIFGPDMSNFKEIRDEFVANNAAIEIKSKDSLEGEVENLINMKKVDLKSMVTNATKIIKDKQEISKSYLENICKYL